MSGAELYITRVSAWAPGVVSPGEWDEWARGRLLPGGSGNPEITFTDPLFRRRLSQISKMTIKVVHDLLPLENETKMFFLSFRGELSRQYQINKMLIEEKSLLPAAFSLSVFNAPAALASMAAGLKGGYSALYPGGGSFMAGVDAARAALLSGTSAEIIVVYADEEMPKEYRDIFPENPLPFAFGFLLSKKPSSLSVPLSPLREEGEDNPQDFLKRILLSGRLHVSP